MCPQGPPCPGPAAPDRCGGRQPGGMPPAQPCRPRLLLLLLLLASQVRVAARLPPPVPTRLRADSPVPQPQAPSAQAMDFLFEKWKLYGDQCLHNLSLLPPPTGEPHALRPGLLPNSPQGRPYPPTPCPHLQVRKLRHGEASDWPKAAQPGNKRNGRLAPRTGVLCALPCSWLPPTLDPGTLSLPPCSSKPSGQTVGVGGCRERRAERIGPSGGGLGQWRGHHGDKSQGSLGRREIGTGGAAWEGGPSPEQG